MAKHREPLSIHDATRKAHAALGNDGVREITGRSAALVLKWSDPDAENNHIPLHQAISLDIAMIKAGHHPSHLEAFKEAIEAVLPPSPMANQRPLTLTEQTLKVTESVGSLSAEVSAALADNTIKAPERRRLNLCIEAQMNQLRIMQRMLKR